MSELFLGIIAVAALVAAINQVVVLVLAARAARQVGALTAKFEQEIRPVIASLQAAAADAARSTALAAAHVERADRLLTDAGNRVERILGSVQHTVSGASRMSGAWLAGLRTAVNAYREMRDTPPKRRRAPSADEDDSLFIG